MKISSKQHYLDLKQQSLDNKVNATQEPCEKYFLMNPLATGFWKSL